MVFAMMGNLTRLYKGEKEWNLGHIHLHHHILLRRILLPHPRLYIYTYVYVTKKCLGPV